MLKAPYPWFGGKSQVMPAVWARFGNVRNFVDPFLGSCASLLCRPEPFEGMETVNDLDCYVANFWRALQADPEAVARYADWPINEADLHARHHWLVNSTAEWRETMHTDPDHYDVKIAGWWVWGICQWIGGHWCKYTHRRRPDLGMGRGVHRTTNCDLQDYMIALANRLRRVRVCCGDWSRVLGPAPTVVQGLTAVFLDPPYSHDSRTPDIYSQESLAVAHDVRAWCLDRGDDPRIRIALCGYDGEHNELERHGWTVKAWKASGGYGRGDGNGLENARRERIWFSPHCIRKELRSSTDLDNEVISRERQGVLWTNDSDDVA